MKPACAAAGAAAELDRKTAEWVAGGCTGSMRSGAAAAAEVPAAADVVATAGAGRAGMRVGAGRARAEVAASPLRKPVRTG